MTDCKWCGRQIEARMLREYCSNACWNAAIRHAAEVVEASANGEELPERPDPEEARRRMESASKWTPGKMRQRIQSLKRGEA